MDMKKIVDRQREYFETFETKDFNFRIKMLDKLKAGIKKYEEEIMKALKKDLNKSEYESYATEIGFIYKEITMIKKGVKASMLKTKVKNSLTTIFGKSYILNEPHGVCLIIAPWNYPFQLAISPLLGAIIGGNTAIIKPSELTPATSKVMKKLIKDTFEEKYITVVEGAVKETTELLEQEVDFVFFTGSPQVGKIIMSACAKQLVPCVLELGGKSPIIYEKVNAKNIEKYAKRICFGKFINSGQTCIAPDYLLVHEDEYEPLLNALKKVVGEIFKEKELTHIVNKNHFERLISYMKDGELLHGGNAKDSLLIEPTFIKVNDVSKKIMTDEIFGPILPIITYKEYSEVEAILKKNKNPLAFYVFSDDIDYARSIIAKHDFGGGCINDTIKHITNKNLPFGGKQTSGIGRYGGANSFKTFTYQKGMVEQSGIDLKKAYPNTDGALKFVKKVFK